VIRVLMVGLSSVFVRLVDGQIPDRSIVVLEEPDLIEKRHLEDLPSQYACVAEIIPATYQQGGNYLEVAAEAHRRWSFDAVMPSLEYSVPAAAEVADLFGLPGAGKQAGAILQSKISLREATGASGMLGPRWSEIDGPQAIQDFAEDRAVVVKPADRQASLGVHLLEKVTPELSEQVWAAMQAAEEAGVPNRPMRHQYLVEERLVGPEYSVEAMVRDGEILFRNVTEKRVIPGVHPVEIGHLLPAPLSEPERESFHAAMRQLVEAIHFRTGILHAEFIRTDAGVALVECAGRCPGDHLMMLQDLAYGFVSRRELITMHAGRTPSFPQAAEQSAAIEFFRVAPGEIVSIDGEAEARALPGVRDLKITAEPGARVAEWASSFDRIGYVVAVGPDAHQARDRAARAASTIRIETRKPAVGG
jgi:biotin carboxylase